MASGTKAAPVAARATGKGRAPASAKAPKAGPAAKAGRGAAAKAAPSPPPAARKAPAASPVVVERVQTGFRMEKRLLKVLKAVAEYHDMALGDLVEGIVLHAFDGRSAFGRESMQRIAEFKRLYGLDLDSSHAHRLAESA
jgi:hypothetical protein